MNYEFHHQSWYAADINYDLNINISVEIPNNKEGKRCVVIDEHALIQSIGKPNDCSTFGGFWNIWKVNSYYSDIVKCVDVVFDRYIGQTSIKSTTRTKGQAIKDQSERLLINRMWDCFKCGHIFFLLLMKI